MSKPTLRDVLDAVQSLTVRFDGIDRRLDVHDGRFDGIDGRLDAHDGRFDRIEVVLAQHGQALAELSSDLRGVRQVVDGHTLQLERIERLQRTETATLDDHERRIKRLESRG